VKASVTSETTQAHQAAPSAPIAALEELLTTASQLVAQPGGAGLVLFLDELHAADRSELAVLLNVLQNLDGNRANVPLAVFAAGLPSTPDAITKAATFGERTSFSQLLALPRPDASAALVDAARGLGVSWSPDALEAVLDAAHGYPYFLQLLGSSVWEHARPEAGDLLTLDHVVSGAEGAVEQLAALYQVRWNAATDGEKDLMVVMADLSPTGEAVTRRDVADALGKSSRAISMPRDRLLEKGVIEAAGHGMLRFTLPGFAAYVRAQTGSDEVLSPKAFGLSVQH
jgi:hypothetical protein